MLQSKFRKIAVGVATGAIATLAAAGPAAAATAAPTGGGYHHHFYKGKVIAHSGLLLRTAPNKGGHVVGSKPYGAIVKIKCKVRGQNIDGNNRWYVLKNGHYAFASARYIKNIGPAPRWC
ncbi:MULTISPECIES: SH3 domain-containing protein [Streptomyces]|uniref:SH3 domain-containing protein n=1 Tax=Streptomyces TaxID=1883 RepID=UPI001D152E7C|nr:MULTISPECIES: SH3 domain-containing protein [Streptomyces]MCC3651718.1 SH3 domain-containing protein [Streptomyces sp. S07_1.15]WSQ73520.1 SH3 domain-containing protein [Streptomyces xinghaiensis]